MPAFIIDWNLHESQCPIYFLIRNGNEEKPDLTWTNETERDSYDYTNIKPRAYARCLTTCLNANL